MWIQQTQQWLQNSSFVFANLSLFSFALSVPVLVKIPSDLHLAFGQSSGKLIYDSGQFLFIICVRFTMLFKMPHKVKGRKTTGQLNNKYKCAVRRKGLQKCVYIYHELGTVIICIVNCLQSNALLILNHILSALTQARAHNLF